MTDHQPTDELLAAAETEQAALTEQYMPRHHHIAVPPAPPGTAMPAPVVVDHRADIEEGQFVVKQSYISECYCGFSCAAHDQEADAMICMLAHRLFCEWQDHLTAHDELRQKIAYPF